ncbi:MAG TPA: hypothetical protein VE344_01760 [Methylomirabilota bacterium]|nr:hypothetical protein [Methylomirabilota bacterium]
MKPDDFEQKLQRQSLRRIPGDWRGEILQEGRACSPSEPCGAVPRPRPTLNWSWLSTIFWPHPKAWAGLAAIWIFIFAVNFSVRDKSPMIAEKISPPSPEMIVELKQQQRLFAELIGANDLRDADRQKLFFPRPRTERAEILTA